jgi:hypothetical protein
MSDIQLPVRPKFWSMNFGQICTVVVFVVGLIWGVAAFATKSTADLDGGKSVAAQLTARMDRVDEKAAKLDSRMVAVETSIGYIRESIGDIRESMKRIEQAITTPKK